MPEFVLPDGPPPPIGDFPVSDRICLVFPLPFVAKTVLFIAVLRSG